MFEARITKMFNIEYPIIQGGMMFVGTWELAAAVSNAGCLGMIAAAITPSPEELRAEIRKLKNTTEKPFGVNLSYAPTYKPIDRETLLDIAVEEGATAVETTGPIAEPSAEHIRKSKVKWIHKVARVKDAITEERRLGADIVAVVGYECGGAPSRNDNPTFILVPLVANAVKIPILAGGGVGDGRSFVAALVLGADGVLMGTRLVATEECVAHPNIKETIIKASESDTTLVQYSDQVQERVFRNKIAETVQAMEKKGATWEEKREFISGERSRKAFLDGDIDFGMLPMGQIIGQIREVVSVKALIESIVQGAREIHKRLQSVMGLSW